MKREAQAVFLPTHGSHCDSYVMEYGDVRVTIEYVYDREMWKVAMEREFPQ